MFKAAKNQKNYLNANDLIIKAMFKRRRLAISSIAHICNENKTIRVIK